MWNDFVQNLQSRNLGLMLKYKSLMDGIYVDDKWKGLKYTVCNMIKTMLYMRCMTLQWDWNLVKPSSPAGSFTKDVVTV